MSRLFSLVLSAAYLVAALLLGSGEDALMVLGFVLVSLACIWFGDELGDFTGWTDEGRITARTPGGMVRFVGWLLLLLPAAAFAIQHLRAG